MDWNIAGHKRQLKFLENAVADGHLAHGLLFAGPVGVGKHTVAVKLAQVMLCETQAACGTCSQCRTFLTGANPDYIEISGESGIKIEQIRELTYKLSLKAYFAKYKVAVIDCAEEMTEEAANSLLKCLEEPTDKTLIILITSNPNRLPKTIVSRAQKITFGPLRSDELANVATSAKTAENQEELSSINGYYDKIFKSKLSERLVLAAELSAWETPELKKLFQVWLTRLQMELQTNPSLMLAQKIRAVTESEGLFNQNVNSKLLFANLMLKI